MLRFENISYRKASCYKVKFMVVESNRILNSWKNNSVFEEFICWQPVDNRASYFRMNLIVDEFRKIDLTHMYVYIWYRPQSIHAKSFNATWP